MRLPSVFFLPLALVTANAAGPHGLLRTACETADAVVTGSIEPVVLTSSPASFRLTVDGTVKGALRKDAVLAVTWPGSLGAARATAGRYRALWFLRQPPSGFLEILPIGGPNAPIFASGLALPPASPSGGVQLPAGGCPEAVWAIVKSSAPYVDQSLAYQTALETLLQEDPPESAAGLQDFNATMQTFRQSGSANLVTLVLASGIRRQSVDALAQFAAQIPALEKSQVAYQAGFAIAAWRNSDPAAIAALGAIAQSGGAEALRGSAAQALMMIHTGEAVPHLARLLSSTDPQLRNAAVRGLSLFVKGVPVLSAENVRSMAYFGGEDKPEYLDEAIAPYVSVSGAPVKTESKYVSAWSEWWTRMAWRFN